MTASPCSCGGHQRVRCLLEIESGREETVQEVPGACRRDLPDSWWGSSEGWHPWVLLFVNREGLVVPWWLEPIWGTAITK